MCIIHSPTVVPFSLLHASVIVADINHQKGKTLKQTESKLNLTYSESKFNILPAIANHAKDLSPLQFTKPYLECLRGVIKDLLLFFSMVLT